tara:strand:+ start:56 stop:889 length:834 start_codon:yes stop_codon:yes gene_type:complete
MIGGIELGGTKCIVAVGNNPTDIVSKQTIPTSDPVSTLSQIRTFFDRYNVDSMGVGCFGPIVLDSNSEDYGLIISDSKVGWKGVNIFHELSSVSDNIRMDTDVNAAALGEYKYGAAQHSRTFVYITIGTGIGVGVLYNGKPYVGNFHLEAGHIFIPNEENIEGICRVHGNCWEGLASGPALIHRWGANLRDFPPDHEVWVEEARLLAFGIINILSNHSPDKIVLGGGVMSQSHLYKMIRSNIDKLWNSYTPLGSLSELVVEPALGKESGIIGSLSLV